MAESDTSATSHQTKGLANVSFVIDNDTPYDIKEIMVMHKYNGLPTGEGNTHIRVEHDLRSQQVSGVHMVKTMVGWDALRSDWWLLSWRFKAKKGQKCPACLKEDGSCESYVSDPDNSLMQSIMDPGTYVKLGGVAANVVVTALSFGTLTAASVALTATVANMTTGAITSDSNTDGFLGCGLHADDDANMRLRNVPVRIRISPVYEEGDYVALAEGHDEIPRGAVGKVQAFDAATGQVQAKFYNANRGVRDGFVFQARQLLFAHRIGDRVEIENGLYPLYPTLGTVVGYDDGRLKIDLGEGRHATRYSHEVNEVVCDTQSCSREAVDEYQKGLKDKDKRKDPKPKFQIDIWLYREDVSREAWEQNGRDVTKVRKSCPMCGASTPCTVDKDKLGESVPITVVNKATRNIKSWSVIHKMNGVTPATHIVDSSESLPLGTSSYRAPETGEPGVSLVRTDTSTGTLFGPHDYWTIAWAYEGEGDTSCEVQTAMEMGFLATMVNNPVQNLLTGAVSLTTAVLGVPVYYSGALTLGKYQTERYLRNNNTMEDQTHASFQLFGPKLLNLLAKGTSVRGLRKCKLHPADVANGKEGLPVKIEIYDDRVEIFSAGGDQPCQMEIAPMSCLHSEQCLATERCKELMARTAFTRPASMGAIE